MSFPSHRSEWQPAAASSKPEITAYDNKKRPPSPTNYGHNRRVSATGAEVAPDQAVSAAFQHSYGAADSEAAAEPYDNTAHLPPTKKRIKISNHDPLAGTKPSFDAADSHASEEKASDSPDRDMQSFGPAAAAGFEGQAFRPDHEEETSKPPAGLLDRQLEQFEQEQQSQQLVPKKKKRLPMSAMTSLMGLPAPSSKTTGGRGKQETNDKTRRELQDSSCDDEDLFASGSTTETELDDDIDPEKERTRELEDSSSDEDLLQQPNGIGSKKERQLEDSSSEEEWEQDEQKPSTRGRSKERIRELEDSSSEEEEWDDEEKPSAASGSKSGGLVLRDNDILCGMGRDPSRDKRAANLRYRQLIGQRSAKFHGGSKETRKAIVQDIIKGVGGRFLAKDGDTYKVMDEEFVKNKIYAALAKAQQKLEASGRIVSPGVDDVLCGTAHSNSDHLGNQKYRNLVMDRKAEFLAALPIRKTQIIAEVRSNFSRFLKKAGDGHYEEADEEFVSNKLDIALRRKFLKTAASSSGGAQIHHGKRHEGASVALPQPSPDVSLATVGSRISIWWPAERAYFEGTVVLKQRGRYPWKVDYDDGESEWYNLREQHFLLLSSGQTEDAEQDSNSDESSDLSWASGADRKMKSNEAKAQKQGARSRSSRQEIGPNDDAHGMDDVADNQPRASVSPVHTVTSSNQMSFVDAVKEYGELKAKVDNPVYRELQDLILQRLQYLKNKMSEGVSARCDMLTNETGKQNVRTIRY